MKKVLVVIVLLALCGGAGWYFQEEIMVMLGIVETIDEGDDPRPQMDVAPIATAEDVKAIEPAGDDVVFDLSIDNTAITFVPYKRVAGELAKVGGGWEQGLGDPEGKLSGKVICDAEAKTIKQIRLVIDTDTLWSEHPMLTTALKERGFFMVEKYPKATFITSKIVPASGAKMEGATHVITGDLTVNEQTRSITFPAKIELAAEAFTLDSRFTLNRKPFNLNYTDPWPGMSLKDENIEDAVVMELKVNTAGEEATAQNGTDTQVDAGPVDLAGLPKTVKVEADYTSDPFELVLVPGDPDKGIQPFYMSKYETTWGQFMPWAYCNDIDETEAAKQRAKELRPSTPYQDTDRGYGIDGYPALSMSRLSAEMFCKYLSQKTGKKFRLPTEAEWEHAYRTGGYDPSKPLTEAQANEMAVWMGNSVNDDLDGQYATRPIGSMKPNKLGIHDMAGNLAEWVTDTGDEKIVRGGHFDGEFADLGGALEYQGSGRIAEDQEIWNETYPNYPKSKWWYVEGRWVGFRVVMEASSAK